MSMQQNIYASTRGKLNQNSLERFFADKRYVTEKFASVVQLFIDFNIFF